MIQNTMILVDDVVTLRLIDGTEIIGQYTGKDGSTLGLRNIMKILIDQDNNVATDVFMAGISNMPVSINGDHVTIMCKTHETMRKSYLELIGGK